MSRINSRIKVRIKRKWRGYSVGEVISPPAAVRQILISDEIAEIYEEAPKEVKQEPPRPRGRPKKVVE